MIKSCGKIYCVLVMVRFRVMFLKFMIVFRLEFIVVLLFVKISFCLKKELKFGVIFEVFWIDSEVV